MSRRQYSCGPAVAGAALPKNAAEAIAAAPKVKSFVMFSLQDLSVASRGRVKTRPSRPAFELVEGCEERLAGNHVDVEARLLVVPVFVGVRALGPVSLRDAVLLG